MIPRHQLHRMFETTGHDPRGLLHVYEEGVMAKVFEKLWEHYPGHQWSVRVDAKQNYVHIALPILMGKTLGYVLAYDTIEKDAELKSVIHAGGEILERWRMKRGEFDLGQFLEARRDRRIVNSKDKVPT